MQDEYALKYLTRLGAIPTADNIALVLENLPLDECHVATAWRSRGSHADVLTIDLYPHARPDARKHAAAEHASVVDIARRQVLTRSTVPSSLDEWGSVAHTNACVSYDRTKPDSKTTTAPTSTNQDTDNARVFHGALGMFQVGPVCLSFEDMTRKYLLPFKHSATEERDVLATHGTKHDDEPPPFVDIPALSNGSAQSAVHILGRRAAERRAKCMDERVVPPDARTDVVQQIQSAFFRALPLAALGVRGEHDTRVLCEAVTDATLVTPLIQSLARYLFLQVFAKLACIGTGDSIQQHVVSGHAQRLSEPVETLFVAVVGLFARLKRRMEREVSNGMRLIVPLLLLELRVAIDTLYRLQYPVSFSATDTTTMQFVLARMDAEITKVIDPDEHWSRIGVLETTCASTKVQASHSFQAKKRQTRLRDQFYQTSAALRCLFPRPRPGKCRQILTLRGGASVANYPPHLEAPEGQPPSSIGKSLSKPPIRLSLASPAAEVDDSSVLASVDTKLKLLRIVEHRTLQR